MNNKAPLSILIVEDNLGHRNIYRNYLDGVGYKIHFATNYDEAINALKVESFDVALVDIKLEEEKYDNRDGLRIAGAISKMEPGPRVILATGLTKEIDSQTAQYVSDIFDKKDLSNEQLVIKLVNEVASTKVNPILSQETVRYFLQKTIERMAREKTSLDEVYTRILEFMVPMIGAEIGNLFIVKENLLEPGATYPQSESDKQRTLEVEKSISGLSIRRYHYVYESDLQKESDITKLYQRGLINARSELAIPVIFGIEPLAVLNFESSEAHAFDKIDKELLEKEIIPLFAFAIHDAMLQQSLIEQARHVIQLSDISEELNSTIQEGEDKVANMVLDKMVEFLNCTKAAIFMVIAQDGKKLYSLIANKGLSKEYEEKSQRIDLSSPRAYTVRTGLPIYINDIENDEDIKFLDEIDFVRTMASGENYRSILEQPLQVQGNTIGSIVAYYTDCCHFKEGSEEIALAQMFADHAAIAIDNAKQYKALQDAQSRERMAIVGELSGDLVHRLNSPLSSIRANLMFIQMNCQTELNTNEYLKNKIGEIFSIAEKAIGLVETMRNQARDEIFDKPIDIKKMLETVIKNTHLPNHITLENHIAKKQNIPLVKANEHIQKVFQNLINNAIKAMPKGMPQQGKLIIDAPLVGDDDIEVSFEDTGIGIPFEWRESIFDILSVFAKDAEHKGQGLGLWYCQAYIEACGGKLPPPESIVGKGTKFTIRLKTWKGEGK